MTAKLIQFFLRKVPTFLGDIPQAKLKQAELP